MCKIIIAIYIIKVIKIIRLSINYYTLKKFCLGILAAGGWFWYIKDSSSGSIANIALKSIRVKNTPTKVLTLFPLTQIVKEKLPNWFCKKGLYFLFI